VVVDGDCTDDFAVVLFIRNDGVHKFCSEVFLLFDEPYSLGVFVIADHVDEVVNALELTAATLDTIGITSSGAETAGIED
jgi:hypothetical protein